MKTKKEICEAMIKRNVWNHKRDEVVQVMIIISLIVVSIWKCNSIFVHFDFYTCVKIYLIAIGGGYIAGLLISYCCINIDLEKEKRLIKEKINEYRQEIKQMADELVENLNLKYPAFEEEQKRLSIIHKKTKKLSTEIEELEVKYLMLESIGNIYNSPGLPGSFFVL